MDGYKIVPFSNVEHLEPVIPLLVEAFWEDPKFVDIFPDTQYRNYQLAWLFQRLVWLKVYRTDSFHFVLISEKTNKVEGCIFLTPFETPPSLWEKIQLGLLMAPYHIGFRNFQTMMRISSVVDTLEAEYVQETGINRGDYFLVSHVAISPTLQGKGLGKMLVNFVIEFSKSKGRSLFLDTSKASSVEFYKKCGFKLGKTQYVGEKPYTYVMERLK